MRLFKPAVIIFSIITLLLSLFIEASAINKSLSFSIFSDSENLKPGKSFNIYINIHDETKLGAVQFRLIYPEELSFKKAEIENKIKNEYLRYNEDNNCITIIYAVKNEEFTERTLKFRFEQKYSEENEFHFKTDFIEALNIDQKEVKCLSEGEFDITAAYEESEKESRSSAIVHNSYSESSERNKENSSTKESSKKQSKKEKNKSKADYSEASEKSEHSEQSKAENSKKEESISKPVKKFDYEKYKDELSDNSALYYTIGIVVILIIVIILIITFLKRLNKKYLE